MQTTPSIRANSRLAAWLLAAALAIAGWSAPVFSATLEQAKSQGLVGEQANGYLGIVATNVPADVKALVADINQRRKSEYQGIAQRNNASLEAVEALAGKKAVERAPPGQYVRLPEGRWVRR